MCIRVTMTLADLLDGFEEGRITRVTAMRWLACRRYADFLRVLDVNHRHVRKGKLPFRPLRQQIVRNLLRRRGGRDFSKLNSLAGNGRWHERIIFRQCVV